MNAMIADFVSDANAARPVTAGGTGAVTAAAARDALGLEIGSDIPAFAAVSGMIYGLTLSNNGTDATNDIDIATGSAIDSTNAHVMTLASALTKRLDAAWAVGTNQGGLDTGSIANTTYHVYLIKRLDTGVVDAIFSASATSPTLPTNYTLFRRIGSIIRLSGAIIGFTQNGDRFTSQVVFESTTTNPGTSAVTHTLVGIPTGIVVDAIISGSALFSASSGNAPILYSPLAVGDFTPLTNGAYSFVVWDTTVTSGGGGQFVVQTNTSAQIRSRFGVSNASTVHRISTCGWIDRRGR